MNTSLIHQWLLLELKLLLNCCYDLWKDKVILVHEFEALKSLEVVTLQLIVLPADSKMTLCENFEGKNSNNLNLS